MKKFLKFGGIVTLSVFVFLPAIFLIVFILWGVRDTNAPTTPGVSLPVGSQVLQVTDTHTGFFRTTGVAAVLIQVPPEQCGLFADYLLTEGFVESPYGEFGRGKLDSAGWVVDEFGQPDEVLWFFEDNTIAFTGEPFSDYYAAAFDMDSGLFCAVEFDC